MFFSGLDCRQREASTASSGDSFHRSGDSDFRGDFFRLILSDLSLTGKRKIPKTRFLISHIREVFLTKKIKPKANPAVSGFPTRQGAGFMRIFVVYYAHCLRYFAIRRWTVANSSLLRLPSSRYFSASSVSTGASFLLKPTPFNLFVILLYFSSSF